jgi:D-glycero-D-manno-heptose 1,7-bisphosphate phosphatase
MQASTRPALFLDRDGVINVDRGFVARRRDFEWLPGIFDAVRTARRLGFAVVVVTNQSGIGRGYYSEADFADVTAFMRERFVAEQAPLDAVYHCSFHPEAVDERLRHPDHPWRKPRPGMILAARDDLGLDLARSAMVGDRLSDVEAGAAAGVGALALIGPGEPLPARLASVDRLATVADIEPWLRRAAARWN